MRVTVQLFASLRERAGRQDWTLDVPAGCSAGDVWRTVVAAHPALTEFNAAVSCAVNAEFASMTTEVHDGDDLAFLPPVSGGCR